jgi:hypothetical protein
MEDSTSAVGLVRAQDIELVGQMPSARAGRTLWIVAAAIAVVIYASTANAVPQETPGGEPPKHPNASEGSLPAELLPKPADTAVGALAAWIRQNPHSNAGGIRLLRDPNIVEVYWKGTAPPGLQSLAANQPVTVTFKAAAYSNAELESVAKAMGTKFKGIVAAAGPMPDYSGVGVTLKSTAPSTALADIKAAHTVPIILEGTGDPVPAAGRSSSQVTKPLGVQGHPDCWSPARCGDSDPLYGGSLYRVAGVSGSGCSAGTPLYAPAPVGTYEYVTTAAHCGQIGTWEGYDNGFEIGTVNVAKGHVNKGRDIQLISHRTWTGTSIYNGDWNTYDARGNAGVPANRVQVGQPVVVSAGVSGNGAIQPVLKANQYWEVNGVWVGPGFRVGPAPSQTIGYTQRGDSGSPVIRSTSRGNFEIHGFVSALLDYGTCNPGRHPGFNGPCYIQYYAVYSDAAIAAFGGVTIRRGCYPC